MMEGISSEAASFAAHQRLSNLCWIYDSNRVTIEGHTDITFTEDVAARFIAYGWNVTTVADANDLEQVANAFHDFKAEHERPTLIVVHSHIGYGTPVEDTPKAHGEPLGPEGVKATKRFFGWPEDAQFLVPDGVYDHFADGHRHPRQGGPRGVGGGVRGRTAAAHPDLAAEIEAMQRRDLPDGWDADIPTFPADPKGIASRDSSGQVLNAVAQDVPVAARRRGRPRAVDEDPADVRRRGRLRARRPRAAATSTSASASTPRPRSRTAWPLSKLRPFWSGFLIFSDYARGAIRLSALMEIPIDPRLHARLDRRRRGRPDAPAGRAARVAARDPGPARLPPGRRQRGRRDVADRDARSSASRRC